MDVHSSLQELTKKDAWWLYNNKANLLYKILDNDSQQLWETERKKRSPFTSKQWETYKLKIALKQGLQQVISKEAIFWGKTVLSTRDSKVMIRMEVTQKRNLYITKTAQSFDLKMI
jgi:hypothetical protein